MRSVVRLVSPAFLVRVAAVGVVGALAAGCSADVSRFSGSFFGGGNDADYTGSLPPTPTESVSSAPLASPGGQPARYGAAATQPAGDGTSVVVGQGDSVLSIANRYGVPANALMQVNGISDASAVKPGQRLVIPVYSQSNNGWVRPEQSAGTPVKVASLSPAAVQSVAAPARPTAKSAAGGVHTVAPGETVYSLGRLYDVRPADIIAANSLQQPYGIRIGQKLTIPGAKGATVASSAPQPAVPAQAPKVDTAGAAAPVEQQPVQVAAVAPPKPSIDSAPIATPGAEPDKTAYAPQNDPLAGTDTRTGVSEPAAMSAGSFRWPVRGRIISSFGEKTDGGNNDGINVSVPEGTSVRAAENGVVAYAGNELKGYGNLVLIRHTDEWVTAYAHNSELLVKRGDVVSRGQVIAKAGQTGSVSTPQIHFELRKGSQPVDPLKHLASD